MIAAATNFDPDCVAALPEACDVCDRAGSCSDVTCAGLRVDALATSCDYCETGSCADITCQGLDPNDNAVCTGL